jgi:hypothetical protein
MQKQWFRFTVTSGTLFGLVEVPSSPPTWFEPQLRDINSRSRRELSMADFSPSEWLDILCSASRPIPLSKPLSPKPQEELLFFAKGKLEEMKRAIGELSKGTPEKPGIPPQALLSDDDFVKKYAIFMEDFNKIDPSRRDQFEAVPRKSVQPGKGRTFINFVPVIEMNAQEDLNSLVLYPHQVGIRIALHDDPKWDSMADEIYQTNNIAVATEMPKVVRA